MMMSEIEKKTVLDLVNDGIRMDGRGIDEYRKPKITIGIVKNAQGSAMVELGLTKVLVGVKLGMGVPYPDSQNEGVLVSNTEFAPMASPNFEKGPPSEGAIELARVVDRVIREAKAIDFEKLCVEPGKKVWSVMVDMYPLDMDGNLFDASALGAMAALLHTKIPKLDGEKVNYEELTEPLPVRNVPVSVTFAKIGDQIVVDPTNLEEEMASARLTVGVNEDGKSMSALQKGGNSGFTLDELTEMMSRAIAHQKGLRHYLK